MMGGTGWMMAWTWLFWLLLVIGIALLVLVAVRVFAGGIARPGAARRILDERYARGELSTEEYRERRDLLGGDA